MKKSLFKNSGNSWEEGGGGSSKTPLEWKILGGGGGVQIKESSMGGVWVFSGTTQCKNASSLTSQVWTFSSYLGSLVL